MRLVSSGSAAAAIMRSAVALAGPPSKRAEGASSERAGRTAGVVDQHAANQAAGRPLDLQLGAQVRRSARWRQWRLGSTGRPRREPGNGAVSAIAGRAKRSGEQHQHDCGDQRSAHGRKVPATGPPVNSVAAAPRAPDWRRTSVARSCRSDRRARKGSLCLSAGGPIRTLQPYPHCANSVGALSFGICGGSSRQPAVWLRAPKPARARFRSHPDRPHRGGARRA